MYKRLITLFLLLPGLSAAAPAQEDEFLKPDQAFAISASALDAETIQVRWRIADGYYLYQSKFRFFPQPEDVELGDPSLPAALTKDDPVFGKVQTYRNQVAIDIPLVRVPGNPEMLTLKARSQGCADAGICYPPHTQTVLVALSRAADAPPPVDPDQIETLRASGSSATGDAGGSADVVPIAEQVLGGDPLPDLAALGESLGLDEEDDGILEPEQAFRVEASSLDGNTLKLNWTIAEGTYLYQNKVKVSLSGDGVALGAFALPAPDIKKDSIKPDGTIGDVAVYHDAIQLEIPLLRTNTAATEIQVTATYQGCADRGICYPPQTSAFDLALPAAAGASGVAPAPAAPEPAGTQAAGNVSEQDQIAAMIAGESTWYVIGAFFLIGLGLAFTPCVFPMIPILSGIITGQGRKITTRKAFMLSLVYVLAMALTYTAAGVVAALSGENLQALLQHPVALSLFAVIFVLLAMSMFGFYDIQLPSSWQSRLSEISNRQESGSLGGAAVMGLLSALIVGPCVAPPLAGALIYIGQTGDPVLGGLALFAMSMGMGAPLIVIGTSAGKLLPRAGGWMDAVKAVFGVVMLGVAIYLLERIIPETTAMLLWGLLLIVSAVYMGALAPVPEEATGWRKLWKGLGIALLVYGSLFLVGVAAGGRDALQPLRGVVVGGGQGAAQEAHVQFKRVKTVADLEREVAAAGVAGKPVMLDFYADWCTYCKTMERDIFPHPDVRAALDGFVLLQADITDQDADDKALGKHLNLVAPPALYFWSADGRELKDYRFVGDVTAEQLSGHIARAYR